MLPRCARRSHAVPHAASADERFCDAPAAASSPPAALGRVKTFSGGTEATAFFPAAVAAVQAAGCQVQQVTDGENPVYEVDVGADEPLRCFSKKYNHEANPSDNFAAIMVCGNADEACPVIFGCDQRFSIRYVDPKVSDGESPEVQAQTYEGRFQQSAGEMLFALSDVPREAA